jgi:hypothetical protein
MVLLEQGALLEDRDREPSGLATSNRERICNGRAATGSPASTSRSMVRSNAVSALRFAVRCWSMIDRDASRTRNAARGRLWRGLARVS